MKNADSRRTRLNRGLCLFLVIVLAGCNCWSPGAGNTAQKPKNGETQEEMEERLLKEEEERLAKKEKPDFEFVRLSVLPADDKGARNLVKPGHWFAAIQTSKANNFDFPKGDLQARCVDNNGQAITLSGTNFDFNITRPISLSKGQTKHVDVLLYANSNSRTTRFQTQLRPRGGGRVLMSQTEPTLAMLPFQNYMVVLADRPANYQFVKSMRSVRLKRPAERMGTNFDLDYFVKLPTGLRRVDLPSHPLTWTNVAYVIWDDFDPEILTLDQQRAMVDWLQWGGQLIINGPRTLDRLSASIFAEYLPARAGEVGKLTDDAMAEVNANWSFDKGQPLTLRGQEPPMVLELKLHEDATFVEGTAKLVAQRNVGRGRIVASAFNMPHEIFTRWDGWDGLFNACFLARPPRQFDEIQGFLGDIVDQWAMGTFDMARDDPRLTSQVRYFTRDAMGLTNPQTDNRPTIVDPDSGQTRETDAQPFGSRGFANDPRVGVGGWNDDSDASQISRRALQTSAGIKVPSIDFIAKTLGIYLLALVPLNWLVFRLMGRVEWAWAAVPFIAIVGALAVVKIAQLDIGFARSRTEIAIVETQPGYHRAHVTRYLGLYSSLSSRYQIFGEDPSSLIQPFSGDELSGGGGEAALYQGTKVALTGFNVLSNSTGMLHSEHFLELGGPITMSESSTRTSISNQSDYDLQGAVLVQRTLRNEVRSAWLGDLKSKTTQDASFQPLPNANQHINPPEWEESTTTKQGETEGELNIRRLIELALDPARMGLGETVLVGWNEQLLPKLTVKPAASQVTVRTLFVSQLRHAQRPRPQRDVNSYMVLRRKSGWEDDEVDAEVEDFGDFGEDGNEQIPFPPAATTRS